MAAATSRRWTRSALFALAVHAAFIAFAVWSVKIPRPPPEPQAVTVELAPPEPPPRSVRRTPPPGRSSRTLPPSPVRPPPAPPAAPAPETIPIAPVPASGDAEGRLRSLLRGSVGCTSAAFLKLDEAEQRKCASWRAAHVDPDLRIPAPIDPAKRAWFDASLQARKDGRAMPIGPPGLGHAAVQLFSCGAPLAHGIRLGATPCTIGLPPGAFNDDDAPAP